MMPLLATDGASSTYCRKASMHRLPQLAQVQEVEVDCPQPRHQQRFGAAFLQPQREIVGAPLGAPPRFVDVIEQRSQRHALDGLQQGGGREDPLARVVGDQDAIRPGAVPARAAPRHAIQSPQPVFDHIDQRRSQKGRRWLPVRIDQAELLAQHMISQRVQHQRARSLGNSCNSKWSSKAQRIM